MFECTYKFTEEDNVIGTIYTMQKQPKKSLKVLKWTLPFLLILNLILLVMDIKDKTSVFLDIVMIIVVIACMLLVYNMNSIYRYSARVSYRKVLADKDLFSVYMDEKNCTVAFFKDNVEVAKEVLDWKDLTDFVEDDNRLILIFGIKFVIVRKDLLKGELDLLKIMLTKYAKNRQLEQKHSLTY